MIALTQMQTPLWRLESDFNLGNQKLCSPDDPNTIYPKWTDLIQYSMVVINKQVRQRDSKNNDAVVPFVPR